MTGTINITPCPECKKVGGLYIDISLVAKPLGTWSLSGIQTKTMARQLPILKCDNCTFNLVGEFDGESHAVFGPPREEQSNDLSTSDSTDAPTPT